MNIVLLFIVLFIIIIVIKFSNFTPIAADTPYDDFPSQKINDELTKKYLNDTVDVRKKIHIIINDSQFKEVLKYTPGLSEFKMSGDPPSISVLKTQGDPTKISKLDNTKLLIKASELIDLINEYIELAQSTTDVYTPDQLKAFNVYYQNMLNNIKIIKGYLEKK